MFEAIGKKLVKGAKAEILEAKNQIDWDQVIKGVFKIAEIGLFALVIFSGRGKSSITQTPTTVIVNNYISKGE